MIEKLYSVYHNQLLWYCINLSNNNRAFAEDIMQDTFLRVLEHAHILTNLTEAQCLAWFYKTAKNIFIDKVRRASREPQIDNDLTTEDDLSEVIVRQLCNQLPEDERELFWMRYIEGYNSSELGELFDMSPSTIRARLSSARKKMVKIYFTRKGKGD
ncbi:MAG: RNA polymerase sigma factor [Eubacteriales bacterium]|nr:RNA polymerase sigma factor [Eubacteriales bacterium]